MKISCIKNKQPAAVVVFGLQLIFVDGGEGGQVGGTGGAGGIGVTGITIMTGTVGITGSGDGPGGGANGSGHFSVKTRVATSRIDFQGSSLNIRPQSSAMQSATF